MGVKKCVFFTVLRSILLLFLCSLEYKLFHIEILHPCSIHFLLHPDFFHKILKLWNAVFELKKEVHVESQTSHKGLIWGSTHPLSIKKAMDEYMFVQKHFLASQSQGLIPDQTAEPIGAETFKTAEAKARWDLSKNEFLLLYDSNRFQERTLLLHILDIVLFFTQKEHDFPVVRYTYPQDKLLQTAVRYLDEQLDHLL